MLGAQRRDRLGLHRFGDGAGIHPAATESLDLVEARLGLVRLRARDGELVGELAQLLFADELAARADEIVLRLEGFGAVLCLAYPVLQLVQPPGQRVGRALRGGRAGIGLIFEIGCHDRIGDARGLLRIARACREIDHVGPFLAARADFRRKLLQHGDDRIRVALPSNAELLQDDCERRAEGRRRLHKFRILVEPLLLDDLAQHGVGGQHPRLALHIGGGGLVQCVRGRDGVVHHAQVVRIDEKLGDGHVARRHQQRGMRPPRAIRRAFRAQSRAGGATTPRRFPQARSAHRARQAADAPASRPTGNVSPLPFPETSHPHSTTRHVAPPAPSRDRAVHLMVSSARSRPARSANARLARTRFSGNRRWLWRGLASRLPGNRRAYG